MFSAHLNVGLKFSKIVLFQVCFSSPKHGNVKYLGHAGKLYSAEYRVHSAYIRTVSLYHVHPQNAEYKTAQGTKMHCKNYLLLLAQLLQCGLVIFEVCLHAHQEDLDREGLTQDWWLGNQPWVTLENTSLDKCVSRSVLGSLFAVVGPHQDWAF